MHSTHTLDCLVVGAGPAGLTAALYLRRFQRRVVVIDHGRSRALAIEWSNNFPGSPQGIAGHDLLQRLRAQLADVQGEVISSEVTTLQRQPQGGFAAPCGDHTWRAHTVLLATGVVDTVPALPGIEQVQQRGLLRQCPICDGHEHRGQRILVLGDGLHAAREAAFLAHFSPHVAQAGLTGVATTVQAGVRLLQARASSIDAPPSGGVRVRLADGSSHEFDVAYAALPVKPRSQLATALGAEVDELDSLVTDEHGATNIHGLYAAGDVVEGLDQLVVAAAGGATAATAIHNLLRSGPP